MRSFFSLARAFSHPFRSASDEWHPASRCSTRRKMTAPDHLTREARLVTFRRATKPTPPAYFANGPASNRCCSTLESSPASSHSMDGRSQ